MAEIVAKGRSEVARLLDTWALRRLAWPLCAARHHDLVFEINLTLNGEVYAVARRCSCGSRTRTDAVR